MMNYLMSGHFTFRHKLAYAIKRTLLFNAIGAVLAIVFILYLAINSNIFKYIYIYIYILLDTESKQYLWQSGTHGMYIIIYSTIF